MRLAAFEINLDVPASGTPESNARSVRRSSSVARQRCPFRLPFRPYRLRPPERSRKGYSAHRVCIGPFSVRHGTRIRLLHWPALAFSGKVVQGQSPSGASGADTSLPSSSTLSSGEFSPPSGPGSANRPLPNRPADDIALAKILAKTCVKVVNLDDRHDDNSNPIDLQLVQ